jgi:hypothetical protein
MGAHTVDDLEEALRNIDIFCKTLVNKMVENEENGNIVLEPIEKLLQRKYVIEEHSDSSPSAKHLIPLPQVDDPLIDVFEHDDYVKVLVQCRCKKQKVTVHTDTDGLEICREECHDEADGSQICRDECRKLNLPVEHLQVENMTAKCNNNEVLEVAIPKRPATS